ASIRGRRLRVSVVSSRDVTSPRSRWRTSPAARRRRRSEYWVVRRPTPRSSSSYSRLTARVAWRRALHRQGVAAGLGRLLLILDVYAGKGEFSRTHDRSRGARYRAHRAKTVFPRVRPPHIARKPSSARSIGRTTPISGSIPV